MKARYVRISTPDQNYERQLRKECNDEKLFIDICSGSIPFMERTEAQKLLGESDITYLTIKAIDRLGRNLYDILDTLKYFEEKGIDVYVEDLGIKSIVNGKPNPTFKMIVSVLANVAEMERNTMLERQKEGIAIAKAKGKYKGRVRGSNEPTEVFLDRYQNVVKKLKEDRHSLREIAKLCDVSLGTVQKVKKLMPKSVLTVVDEETGEVVEVYS